MCSLHPVFCSCIPRIVSKLTVSITLKKGLLVNNCILELDRFRPLVMFLSVYCFMDLSGWICCCTMLGHQCTLVSVFQPFEAFFRTSVSRRLKRKQKSMLMPMLCNNRSIPKKLYETLDTEKHHEVTEAVWS